MTATRYVERLVLELRQRDVPGDRIGEVVAEVEAHVAESGETPEEAFGPPGEYAAHIRDTLGPGARNPLGVVPAALLTLAAMLTLDAVAALTGDGRVDVSAGDVAGLGAVLLAAVLLVRLVTRPRWQSAAAYGLVAPVVVALLVLLREPVLLTLPVWAALTVAAVVGAVGLVRLRRLRDPVVDPRGLTTEPGPVAEPPAAGRRR